MCNWLYFFLSNFTVLGKTKYEYSFTLDIGSSVALLINSRGLLGFLNKKIETFSTTGPNLSDIIKDITLPHVADISKEFFKVTNYLITFI